jgi:serine/threonine-protein kinase
VAETFGKYEIIKEIGRGVFAVVFQARDTTLDRIVALKVIHPVLLSDPMFVQRFQQEAKTLAVLNHPQIITIHEVSEFEGRLYIAMALAGGSNLAQFITRQGRSSFAQMLTILKPIGQALDYAHNQGVIHRDLKPANILLDKQRGPLLSDFGFSRLIGLNSASLTLSGGIVGTAAYIAPEVWENEAATAAADLYALGCIAYEVLTGRVLFDGDTPMQIMRAHDRGAQFSAEALSHLPAGLSTVLQRALHREPSARYPSAAAFLHALQSVDQQTQDGQTAVEQANLAAQWQAETQKAIAAGEWSAAKMAVGRWLKAAPDDPAAKTALIQVKKALSTSSTKTDTLPSRTAPTPKTRSRGGSLWIWLMVVLLLGVVCTGILIAALYLLPDIIVTPGPPTEPVSTTGTPMPTPIATSAGAGQPSEPTVTTGPTDTPAPTPTATSTPIPANALNLTILDNSTLTDPDGKYWEKYESDATGLAGLYLRSDDINRFGDFLELNSDGTFYLEEKGVLSTGKWNFEADQVILTGE